MLQYKFRKLESSGSLRRPIFIHSRSNFLKSSVLRSHQIAISKDDRGAINDFVDSVDFVVDEVLRSRLLMGQGRVLVRLRRHVHS